jgi:uncharacterized protein (TIRG00374 family)
MPFAVTKKILKVGISLGLLALIAYSLDWGEVVHSAGELAWWAPPLAIALEMSTFAIGNARWWLLLRTHDKGHHITELQTQYFIGAFFNNLLPTTTGGDLFRIYYVYRQRHGMAVAVSPVITERIIGLVSLLGLATAVLLLTTHTSRTAQLLADTLPWVFAASAVALAMLGIPAIYWPLHRFFERWAQVRVIAALLHIAEAAHTYVRRPTLVLKLVGLSLIMQFVEVLVFYALGKGLGAPLPLSAYVYIVCAVSVAAALPVSIGGLGVREVTAISLFTSVGMSHGHAAVVSLLFIPVLLLASLPGLFLFLGMKNHKEIYEKAAHDELMP